MRGVNKVIIVGTLGADPEVKYAGNGNAIANLSVATSEEWSDKATGAKQQKTEWHKVSMFGKIAEIAGQFLKKGSQVYLEGKLQTRKWQDQNGQDRYTTEVVISGFDGQMQMLGGGQSTGQNSGHSSPQQQPQSQPQQGFQGGQQNGQAAYQNNQPSNQPIGGQQGRPQQSQQQPQNNFNGEDMDVPF